MSKLAIFNGPAVRSKPFPSWPVFDEHEERAVLDVIRSGKWWCYTLGGEKSDEHHTSRVIEFQRRFAQFHDARYGLACANGTAAIEIALKAAGIGLGDEVIVPAYTFIATATAPLSINAVPIFCDIENDTFNLDPEKLEGAITSRTRAVIPVHFAGMPANMERILSIARKHNLFVLEDAAHAHGAVWNGKPVGTIGDAGTFSFQASKNMTAGEGGFIMTDDHEFLTLCESYIWGGRNVGRPWYEHHRLGWNYRMTELQAAILLQQLDRAPNQTARRMENGTYLNRRLAEIPGLQPLHAPPFVTSHSFHLYAFRFEEEEFGIPREQFIAALAQEGIPCSAGYAHPLYKNPMFLNKNFFPGVWPAEAAGRAKIDFAQFEDRCPNAERVCREAVWIEHRVLLGDRSDMEDVVRAVIKIFEHRNEFAAPAARGRC